MQHSYLGQGACNQKYLDLVTINAVSWYNHTYHDLVTTCMVTISLHLNGNHYWQSQLGVFGLKFLT